MNFKLKRPDMVHEAAKTGGQSLIVELLIFLLVYFISTMVSSIPLVIIILFAVMTDGEFIGAALSGDEARILEAAEKLSVSDGVMFASLLITAITIVVVTLFCKLIQKRKMRTLGFKKPGMWKEYGIGMLIGFGMIAVIAFVCAITGAAKFRFNPDALSVAGIGMLALLLVGFLIQGMSEEVLCRGYLLVSIARKKGSIWLAVAVNAVAFGALHLLNPGLSVLSMLNLILFGVFASIYFVKRGNIWGIAAIHSIWNFTQGNLFGFLVSGQGFGTTLFVSEPNPDMTILNGGSFGLEGGILTTAVLLIGIAIVLNTKQKDCVQEITVPTTI